MEGHARQLRRVKNPRSGTAKYGVLFAASFNREGRPHDRLFGLARHLLLLITAFGHACRQCRVPVDDPADHGRVRIETMRRCISSHAMERPCRTGQCCQSLPRAKSPHLARGRGSLGWRRPLHAQTVPSPGRSPSRWQTGHSGRAKGRSARRLVGRRHAPPRPRALRATVGHASGEATARARRVQGNAASGGMSRSGVSITSTRRVASLPSIGGERCRHGAWLGA